MPDYPTLALIDEARSPEHPRLTKHPHAAQLEQRARQLADEYWSETVWLTGRVPDVAFQAVCAGLEQDQAIEPEAVTLIVAPVMTVAGGEANAGAVRESEATRGKPMEQVVIEASDGQMEQLQVRLARMTAYVKALESRCHVLWAYVPGNQGSQDPIVTFLAEDLGITAATAVQTETLASHD